MHSLFRNSPSLPTIVKWLFDLATWLIARSLQMPEPLLQSAGVFVFARAQVFEDSFGKSLCPIRLVRGALARPSGALTYPRFWPTPAFDLVTHFDVGQCTRAMPDVALPVASGGTVTITLHHGPVPRGAAGWSKCRRKRRSRLQGKRTCARY